MFTYDKRLDYRKVVLPAPRPISLSSSSQDGYPEDAHRTLRISVWQFTSISIPGGWSMDG
jgi:hypothetical protein